MNCFSMVMVQNIPETKERGKIGNYGYHPDKEHQEVSKCKEQFREEGHELLGFIFDFYSGSCSCFEAPYHAEYEKPNGNIRLPAFKGFNGTLKSNGDQKF